MILEETKALLKLDYRCNNNCVFCHSAPHRGAVSDPQELRTKIERAARLGARHLILSGGEPTIRNDLFDVARLVRKSGMAPGLVSNGRMLAYGRLAQRLMGLGLGYVQLSLAGANPQTHDRHARTNSFGQLMKGLSNLAGRVPSLTVNYVVTGWNLDELELATDLIGVVGGCRLKFSLVEPEGNALAFEGVVPKLAEASIALQRALDMALQKGLEVAFDGFPLCLLDRTLWHLESGLHQDGIRYVSEAFESDWYPADERNRGYGTMCNDCSLRCRCRGVYVGYLDRDAERSLRPLEETTGNNFIYAPVQLYGNEVGLPPSPDACPFASGEYPRPEPARQLLVTSERGLGRYETNCSDFNEAAIAYSVRELGQLYLGGDGDCCGNISEKLTTLTKADACRVCPEWRLCGGIWKPAAGNAFDRFNRELRRNLSRLQGNVLDVGCGSVPYLQALLPAIRKGRLRYLGLDPDAAPQALPRGAALVCCELDDFRCGEELFDTVLCIRALAHLGRPSKSIAKMASLVGHGGTLLLAEDNPFGIVSTASPDRCEHPAFFEHRANVFLDQAMTLCRQEGLTPVYWASPAYGKSPCWLLVARKN